VGLQSIREAIRLEGDVPAFHCGLGNVLAECGEVNEAIQAFQHALALQPAFSEAQTGLGKCIVRETTSRLRWRNLTPSSPAA
jgi:Flp pilus assembly protein TadD